MLHLNTLLTHNAITLFMNLYPCTFLGEIANIMVWDNFHNHVLQFEVGVIPNSGGPVPEIATPTTALEGQF